ncbi:hypothetical protein QE152_g19746 [Popillia japonica]|uniref:Uncharacterized protein n=1 Tax=Popillia japonica TaxID=7064 RepID=A0AAW1KPI5_POPJA
MVRLKNPVGKMYVFKEVYIEFPNETRLQLCWVATLNTIIAINAESPIYDHYLYKNDCIIEDCGSDWVKLTRKNDIYRLRFGTEIAKANFLSYARKTNKCIGILIPKNTNIKPKKPYGAGYPLEKVIIKSDDQAGIKVKTIKKSMKGDVKNSINIDQAGIKVKTIKKSMKGDVMLEIHGGKEKAEVLKHEIMNKNCGTKVEIKSRNSTVYVSGIDGV